MRTRKYILDRRVFMFLQRCTSGYGVPTSTLWKDLCQHMSRGGVAFWSDLAELHSTAAHPERHFALSQIKCVQVKNKSPDLRSKLGRRPILMVEGRWRREEALTSALKARGLWYLVSPVAPLLWAWPPPWLWLWGSTPRSCPRRHSSSSL